MRIFVDNGAISFYRGDATHGGTKGTLLVDTVSGFFLETPAPQGAPIDPRGQQTRWFKAFFDKVLDIKIGDYGEGYVPVGDRPSDKPRTYRVVDVRSLSGLKDITSVTLSSTVG